MVTKSASLTSKQKKEQCRKKPSICKGPYRANLMTVKFKNEIVLAGKKVKDFIADFYFTCSFGCFEPNM